MAQINSVFTYKMLILTCILFCAMDTVGQEVLHKVRYLQPGQRLRIQPSRNLEIFCYRGRQKHLINMWQTVQLQLENISNDKYEHYDGSSPEEVQIKFDQSRSSWTLNVFSWKKKDIELNPFNRTCVGITTIEEYGIHLNIIRIDYWRLLLAGAGIFLFFSAPKLSGNALFYYIVGISVGICASFLVLVYMISKFLPMKRPMMYGFVIGGWTIGMYLIQLLWENLRLIFLHYQNHVISYVIFSGLVSFVVCYRLGPVTDHRTKNLIKWALQGAALAMIFYSSHFSEATIAMIVIILGTYNFPAAWNAKIKTYWKRKFPPKTKLMSEDEFHEQGVRETAKALEELRGYCSSPDCDAWKTVLKLKEPIRSQQQSFVAPPTSPNLHFSFSAQQRSSPHANFSQYEIRFANFMNGSSHLSDDEMLAYETEARRSLSECFTDDSDSEGY